MRQIVTLVVFLTLTGGLLQIEAQPSSKWTLQRAHIESQTKFHLFLEPIFCYWGSWSHYRLGNGEFRVNNIDGNLCTHLIYTFLGVSTSGDVRILDSWLDVSLNNFRNTVNLKTKYPHLKVLAGIGGFNEGSYRFSEIAKSASIRDKFAQNVLNLVNQYGFDGADIDWEWPAQRDGDSRVDRANFNLLLQALNAK